MKKFMFAPAECIPFRDKKELDRVRSIQREEIDKHPNPELNIQVVPDSLVEHIFVTDMFYRIKTAKEEGKKVVLLLPNPNHGYIKLAHLINRFNVKCDHLYTFNLDEYADEDGNIAPESYPQGFLRSTKNNLYKQIDEALRPPEDHIIGFTNENINDYGSMITEMGGSDACYTGPGWTGHIAFIEPDAPEFETDDLEEWKKMGPRIVTLSPFTIAQNSLHGSFGMSGDLAAVPPKAATIGPAQVIEAKYRMDMHALNTAGTMVSWQRFMTRLVLHGPVTPKVPTSIIQELKTDVVISETAGANIEPVWDVGY
jgi:6-phosphogluconolactonase/glucosamine-6-phosphate isomerase/deaminase